MLKLKEILQNSLGVIGFIIYYLIMGMLFVMPLVVLDFNWIINLVFIFVMLNIPFLGNIASFILYVWSFAVVFNGDFPVVFCVLYYISLACYILSELIPLVISIIECIINTVRERN